MKNLPFKINLSGKTAVVTGGGGVLCGGFCKTIAACGANVAILDMNLDAAQKLADEINADGGKAIAVSANVLSKDSLNEAKTKVDEAFGGCDILINGAGGNKPKGTTSKEYLFPKDLDNSADLKDVTTFFELDADSIQFVFNLNFLGTLIPTQVFARDMAKRKDPVIINVSSMNAFRPLTKIPAYSAAKAAVSNFTMWLAVHFSKVGIRVNAIAPGFFVTAQNHDLLFNADETPTERAKKIVDHTPMGRFGTPEELDGTLLWLLSAEGAGFVNGVVVPVDGGFAAYSGV